MLTNFVKRKLRNGEVSVGVWVTIPHPDISEIFASLGFDWIIYEMEHSPIDLPQLELLLQGANGYPCIPLARVPSSDPVTIKRVLDAGVYGIVVPHVSSPKIAEQVVKATRYPPQGVRGVGPRRAARYGIEYYEYVERANEEILVVIQIEDREGVERIDEILAVEGIDAYFIGPGDLSASLGVGGRFDHPKVQEAIDRILEAGKRAGVAGGIVASAAECEKYVAKGFQFISLGADMFYLVDGAVAALRAAGVKPRIPEESRWAQDTV